MQQEIGDSMESYNPNPNLSPPGIKDLVYRVR